MRLLTEGPSFSDLHVEFTPKEASAQYRRWFQSWIAEELEELLEKDLRMDPRDVLPKMGTRLVAPGQGSTVLQLDNALIRRAAEIGGFDATAKARRALQDLHTKLANQIGSRPALETKTNIEVVGGLTAEDLRRIENVQAFWKER